MKPCRALFLVAIAAALLAFAPARATDSHDYGHDEYATIRDGLSPDRKQSLAAHGEGEGGSDDFHVWLMAEPAHRRITALEGIGSANNLDTGPNAYHAAWSDDSRHVAVGFRSDRHVLQLNLYAIEGRRTHPVRGSSLFREVAGRDVGAQDDLRSSFAEIEWRGPWRFVLREQRLFLTADAGFAGRLGGYGKAAGEGYEGKVFVEFAAEADCLLMPGNRYRVVGLRAGTFRK